MGLVFSSVALHVCANYLTHIPGRVRDKRDLPRLHTAPILAVRPGTLTFLAVSLSIHAIVRWVYVRGGTNQVVDSDK